MGFTYQLFIVRHGLDEVLDRAIISCINYTHTTGNALQMTALSCRCYCVLLLCDLPLNYVSCSTTNRSCRLEVPSLVLAMLP